MYRKYIPKNYIHYCPNCGYLNEDTTHSVPCKRCKMDHGVIIYLTKGNKREFFRLYYGGEFNR